MLHKTSIDCFTLQLNLSCIHSNTVKVKEAPPNQGVFPVVSTFADQSGDEQSAQ